jgi:hypothetical protein
MVSASYPSSGATADNEEVLLKSYDQVPFVSEGVEESHAFENSETLTGSPAIESSDRVSITSGGSLSCSGVYDGLTGLIACATGYEKAGGTGYPTFLNATNLTSGSSGAGTWVNGSGAFVAGDVGKYIRVTSGSGEGQVRRISGYTSDTTVSVTPNWGTTPSSSDTGIMSNEFMHVFELANSMYDQLWTELYASYPTGGVGTASDKILRRGSLGVLKSSTEKPWVWRSCMVNSMSVAGSAGSGVTIDFELAPFDLDRASGTNDYASTGSWDFNASATDSQEKIMFADVDHFRLGAYSGTELTSSHNIGVSDFSISINNNLLVDTQNASSGLYAVQPTRNGSREVTGSFTVPRYDADTLVDFVKNNTELMADIKFSGSTMDNDARSFRIYINSLRMTKASVPVGGAGVLTQAFDFQAFVPTSNTGYPNAPATGMDAGDQEVTIVMENRYPFNPLQDQNLEY